MHDLDELRRVFLEDQAAAARAEAGEMFLSAAGARGVDYSRRPSGWVLRLLRRTRRNRCVHWPREDAGAVVFVVAHVGQLLCRSCAGRVAGELHGSVDERRCDACREVAELERFMFHAGPALLVSGRCCAGCRPTVYGGTV